MRHVWMLPYGRTSDRQNVALVLSEGRGTCSSKHACVAAVAREQQLPIALVLGIYGMNESNTPGIGPTLAERGLAALPEAHCWIECGGRAYDLTRPGALPAVTEILLHREIIAPEQAGAHKVEAHRWFLRGWLAGRADPAIGFEEAWDLRERCIAQLEASLRGAA